MSQPLASQPLASQPIPEPTVICALYKFVSLPEFRDIREPLLNFCVENGIKGTLLLALEGINGTVSGSQKGIDRLLAYLRDDVGLENFDYKLIFFERIM